jgi:hypothetical protein
MSRRAAVALALITAAGALVRFYGLSWGAPYYHFHIDEHFVFLGALAIRQDSWLAALAPKFFMYSPLPMYVLIGLLEIYERLVGPLDLNAVRDGVTFMVMGRAISATFSTATIPLVFLIARRVSGTTAGLIAAGLLAGTVLHLREAHFFSVDSTLTFFITLGCLLAVRMADRGDWRSYVGAGLALAGGVLSKYSAAFMALPIGVAHLLAPRTFSWPGSARDWTRWTAKGALPLVVGVLTFLILDPFVIVHYNKFRADLAALVTEPLSGARQFVWAGHFTDIQPQAFWFTNILWWGLGPAFEIWGLAGVGWLLWRRDRRAFVAAVFPLAYFAAAGQTSLPFARYGVPLAPLLAVAAGVLSADLLARARLRRAALVATILVIGTTSLYALAYTNIYRSRDARLEASRFLLRHVPANARIMVEPSHNIPPMGSYLAEPSFHRDYVLWGAEAERHDYYRLHALDTYRFLYSDRVSDEDKRHYIDRRLARADYIVTDDTFMQFYAGLPADEHGVVKQFYEDLLAGRLGFELMRSFKVYPSLFGITINDDRAELTFRLFDHPRVFVFRRVAPPGA